MILFIHPRAYVCHASRSNIHYVACRYWITCKFVRGSRSVVSKVRVEVSDRPVPKVWLSMDNKSIPPGKSVIFILTGNFERNAEDVPMTVAITNGDSTSKITF